MNDPNFGFKGTIPLGASIEENIARALQYQETHTAEETFEWFYDVLRNNARRSFFHSSIFPLNLRA